MTVAPLTRPQIVVWRNAVFAVFALSGLSMATWLSRLPAIRDLLDVNTSTLGLIVLGLSSGSIVGLLLSSHVVARLGAARTVLVTIGSGAVGLPVAAGGALADLPIVVFLGLVVFGLGTGMCDVAMNVSGAANERALGRNVMPLFHALFSGGTVVGVGIGALAENAGVPVLLHLGVVSAFVIVSAIVAVRFFQSEQHDAEEEAGSNAALGWRDRLATWLEPRTLLIGLVVLGMAFAEGSANDWLPLAMVDGHGLSNAAGAVVLGVFLVAMTIGRIVGVFLLDRFGRVPVLRGSALLAVLGLGVIIFVPAPEFAVGGAVLWGLGASLGFPVGMSAAADDPRRAAARVSVVSTIGYVAFLVGPPLLGFLGDHFGLLRALAVVFVLVLIAGLASGAARPIGSPAAAQPEPDPERS